MSFSSNRKSVPLPKSSMRRAVHLLYDSQPMLHINDDHSTSDFLQSSHSSSLYAKSKSLSSTGLLDTFDKPAIELLPIKLATKSKNYLTTVVSSVSSTESTQPFSSIPLSPYHSRQSSHAKILAKRAQQHQTSTQQSISDNKTTQHFIHSHTSFENATPAQRKSLTQTNQYQQQSQFELTPIQPSKRMSNIPLHTDTSIDKKVDSSLPLPGVESMKRLGMQQWKVSKLSIGESEWDARIQALKATIKKKMPAFSSKLLRDYNQYRIEPNYHLAHRNKLLHDQSKLLNYSSNASAAAAAQSFDLKSSNRKLTRQLSSSTTMPLDRSLPQIPRDLVESSKRLSESVFFRFSNQPKEKKTLRMFEVNDSHAIIQERSIPLEVQSKNQELRNHTYKAFKNSLQQFYQIVPTD